MKRKPIYVLGSLFVLSGLLLAACGAATPEPTAVPEPTAAPEPTEVPVEEEEMEPMEEEVMAPTIVELAASDESFSTLVAAVEAAGLVDTLASEGPFTVFAPTDAAFEAALAALGLSAEELLADSETLTEILLYHVVPGSLRAADVLEQNILSTAQGSLALAYAGEEGAFINEAAISMTDLEASNGVVHVIDAVILPPSYSSEAEASIVEIAVEDERFSILVSALTEAGLVETLQGDGPFTVFAPTDDAFAAALEALGISAEELLADKEALTEILLYHVTLGARDAAAVTSVEQLPMLNGAQAQISLRDGGAYIDDAQIIITDIEASNGIIHVIDAVILPPQ